MPKTNKQRLPTVEEFLQIIPKKQDFEWHKDKQGIVHISVPKFNSKLGKSFCKIIRKDDKFTADLDALGSKVWENIDGKKNVKKILEIIKKEFPDEINIDQRLFLFIQQLEKMNYISFYSYSR